MSHFVLVCVVNSAEWQKGTYIFAGSATASAAGWRGSLLAVGANRVLLLGVSVECGVAEVGFVAVLAAVVAAVMVVLAAAAPTYFLFIIVVNAVAVERLFTTDLLVVAARELCLFGGLSLLQCRGWRGQERRVVDSRSGLNLSHHILVVLLTKKRLKHQRHLHLLLRWWHEGVVVVGVCLGQEAWLGWVVVGLHVFYYNRVGSP